MHVHHIELCLAIAGNVFEIGERTNERVVGTASQPQHPMRHAVHFLQCHSVYISRSASMQNQVDKGIKKRGKIINGNGILCTLRKRKNRNKADESA